MAWDSPVEERNQIVLFARRLDDVLPKQHGVRRMVEVLEQLHWTNWENEFQHEGRGRPPIHPRVMSGIILYGLMRGVRSSRQLEEALQMRLDFRWLAEGRAIDHSTICSFRRNHAEALKGLFVQITLVAKHAGLLSLVELAVDGTKIRAGNHRSAKFKVEELATWKQQLQLRFDELSAEAAQLDREETAARAEKDRALKSTKSGIRSDGARRAIYGRQNTVRRDRTCVHAFENCSQSRLNQINRAIEAVAELEASGETVPTRVPTTDVESRVTKSKEGGFAPSVSR